MAAAADTDAMQSSLKLIQDRETFIKANVQMGTMDQSSALAARYLTQALHLDIPIEQYTKTIMSNSGVFRALRQTIAARDATIAARDRAVKEKEETIKRHLLIQRKLRDQIAAGLIAEAKAAALEDSEEDVFSELGAASLSKLAAYDRPFAGEAHGGADQTTEAARDDATRRRSNVGQDKAKTFSFKKAGSFVQDGSGSDSDDDSDDDGSGSSDEDKIGGKEEEGGYEPPITTDDELGEVSLGEQLTAAELATVGPGDERHHVHFDDGSNDSGRGAPASNGSVSPTLSLNSHGDSRDSLHSHGDSRDGTGGSFAGIFGQDDSKEEEDVSDGGDDGLDMGFVAEDEAAAGKNDYIELEESDSQSSTDTDDSNDEDVRRLQERMLAEIEATKAAKKAAKAKAKAKAKTKTKTKAKAAEAKAEPEAGADPAKRKTAARSAGSTAIKTEYVGQAAARAEPAEPAKTAERARKKAKTRPSRPYVDPCLQEGDGISELTGPGSTTGPRR